MKTIGVVGGIAPGSTIEYYRLLVSTYRDRAQDDSYPPIIINSINMTRMLELIGAGQLERTVDYLLVPLNSLAAAGAEVGIFASNTPHIVFDELERRSPIPLVSIVRSASAFARSRNLKRLGLFGTRFTMQGRFYPEIFLHDGVEVLRPTPAEQDFIHEKYMTELVEGVFRPETRAALVGIVERFKERNSLDGIILGGTELPLLFRAESAQGIPLLDTGRIHIEAVLAVALA
ncbi:MAG TPA: amino acid racemase [Terriglobales bacterium]|nr:amino acid racemase [Terriglobales bacterium]